MSGVSANSSQRFSLDEIRKATDNFNESRVLGEGSFGRVYKGVIDDESTRTLVAMKRTLDPESKQGISELETEIKMLSRCKHSNLVNLLGYCNENQETILVYEYMSNGNLADHLYRNEGSLLTWEQRLKICIGVARGLDYLHTGTGVSERIIHLDIKSDNILLDDNWVAKIADLGLSRIGPANQPNTQLNTLTLLGTEVYMDPEYRKTGNYSNKSDVYSFGVVLLEVLSGTCAWRSPIIPEFDRANWIQQYISKQTLVQIVDQRIVSKILYGSLKMFTDTASSMLHLDPMKRPSMSSVVAQLESALKLQSSPPVVDEGEPSTRYSVSALLGLTKSGNEQTVFGEPIGDKEMLQMGLDPTCANRALVALHRMDKDIRDKAFNLSQDLTEEIGSAVMTSCMIYNATGETLTYVTSCNLYGKAVEYPYPMKIHNGQWGVFLHVRHSFFGTRSVGAVVYRGKYSDDAFCDRMITWWHRTCHDNAAYCEINKVGHFDEIDWDETFEEAKSADQENEVTWNDCYTSVCIKRNSEPSEHVAEFFALFTQVGVRERCVKFEETLSHTSTES